jgi:hypothetical protein
MEQWMKWVWTLAAMVVVACLLALGHTGVTGGGGYAPVVAGNSGTSPEYFTMHDAAQGTVEYGIREGGNARIYASRPAAP